MDGDPASYPGWVQTEDGVWRRETIHRMGRRLPGWDYRRPGIYMITIVLADRQRPVYCAVMPDHLHLLPKSSGH